MIRRTTKPLNISVGRGRLIWHPGWHFGNTRPKCLACEGNMLEIRMQCEWFRLNFRIEYVLHVLV